MPELTWLPGFDVGGFGPVEGSSSVFIRDAIVWRDQVVVSGRFGRVDGITAPQLAAWDGVRWRALPPIDDRGSFSVSELASWDEDLIATYSIEGYPNVGRFDGERWADLDSSLRSVIEPRAIAAWKGRLLISGSSLDSLGTCVVEWSDDRWERMGSSSEGTSDSSLYRVDEIVPAGDRLFVRGVFRDSLGSDLSYFPAIARWEGEEWRPIASAGFSFFDLSLAEFRGELWAADHSQWPELRLERWSGSDWILAAVDTLYGNLSSMRAVGNALYLYGSLHRRTGEGLSGIAAWSDGWQGMAGLGTMVTGEVHALVEYRGELFRAGDFVLAREPNVVGWASCNPDRPVLRIEPTAGFADPSVRLTAGLGGLHAVPDWLGTTVLRLEHGTWEQATDPLSATAASALTWWNGDLVAALLSSFEGDNEVARWDGSKWSPLGGALHGYAEALAVYRGDLVVAGRFDRAGSTPALNLARWDGARWWPLGSGVFGFPQQIDKLAVWGDELVVAGQFSVAGGVRARGIAAWNGESWRDLTRGLTFAEPFYSPDVRHLVLWNGELVVDGDITHATGDSTDGLARLERGLWRPIPYPEGVRRIGHLIATDAGLLISVSRWYPDSPRESFLYLWDGEEWHSFADEISGLSGSARAGSVASSAQVGDVLYLTGEIGYAGGVPSHHIAAVRGLVRFPDRRLEPGHLTVWPNPTPGYTSVQWIPEANGTVELRVIDVSGREQTRRTLEVRSGRPELVSWDGRDRAGHLLPAGVYWVRVRGAGSSHDARFVMIR